MVQGPMDWKEAVELCRLRITEDKISASDAVRELICLTGCSIRDCEYVFKEFKLLVGKQQ